jgi:phosphoribosylformylglycinamidine synthase
LVLALGERENCPVTPVGVVTTSGNVVVEDKDGQTPFNMPLSLVLGKMPQKAFNFTTPTPILQPLSIPTSETVISALERVLRLLDVGSKRFLTNKVDRSVTGLVAQQQCVGPLQTPLADVAVLAQSHFSTTGVAVAVGEQPIKGLVNNAAQARMTVVEALSNLVFAQITKLTDIKASGNWMWAAKLEGEGAKMYTACQALRDALLALGPAIDGGKDSLSMAAKVISIMKCYVSRVYNINELCFKYVYKLIL